jgi:CDP-diacylglycerol--serine O-phosphatidyltransferase
MADLESREDPYNVTQASRIYILPNTATALNLFCGFTSIIHCIQARLAETSLDFLYNNATSAEHYRYAVGFIFGSAAFDMLDGRLARMGGRESLFGAEFDSLADVVSFGLAPALMMFFFILSPSQGILWFRNIGWLVGFIYLLCAAMRLARFNVITNPLLKRAAKESGKDFVGLPVPAAAACVASTVLFLLKLDDLNRGLKHSALGLPFVMLLIAFLMMSTVRYPSGKNIDLQTRTKLRTLFFVMVIVGSVIAYKEFALLALTLGYLGYGIFRHLRRRSNPNVSQPPWRSV